MNPPIPQRTYAIPRKPPPRTYTIPRKPLAPATGNGSSRQINSASNLVQDARTARLPYELGSTALSPRYSTRRLTKPPKVYTVRKRSSRTRLQKRIKSKTKGKGKVKTPSTRSNLSSVFVLQYEDYPYNTLPGTILGVYSSHDTVTTGAIQYGAYAFSREGMRDGCEYLSPTGRIRIIDTPIQLHGLSASLPKPVPNAIPHPNQSVSDHSARRAPGDSEDSILLALHQSPTGLRCIGAFAERKKAWGACWKHRASMGFASHLQEGTRWLDEDGMPHTKSRLVGTGWHEWLVAAYQIDAARQQPVSAKDTLPPRPPVPQRSLPSASGDEREQSLASAVSIYHPGPQRGPQRVGTPQFARSEAGSLHVVPISPTNADAQR